MTQLICYALWPDSPRLVPAPPTRRWMDQFPDRHAYRCLPLTIANTHGWEILSPCSFEIRWNGGPASTDITFYCFDDFTWLGEFVSANFANGIVTFSPGYIFRTSPGWGLFVSGPLNSPRDGLSALSGVVETDWLPYPFTMNWQLTRPGSYRWDKDEPFCAIFPMPREAIESITPQIHDIAENPELAAQCKTWREQREALLARRGTPQQEAWQRYYFLGQLPGSDHPIAHHKTRIRVQPPQDRRPTQLPPK